MEDGHWPAAGLNHKSGTTCYPAHHYRDGLADDPFPAPVQSGAKMAGGTGGLKSRVKEKSRGGYRSAADGRPVATANRPYQRPRTQPHHGRGLSQVRKENLTNSTLKALLL